MKAWYAVYTKAQRETVAEENLQRQGFETYLPWITHPRRRRGKWLDVTEPLFPRYLFTRLDPAGQDIGPMRSTFGVTRLVTFGDQLRAVPEALIESLRNAADSASGQYCPDRPLFQPGDHVVVLSGPFEGLNGLFQTTSGKDRVAILLDILGRTSQVVLRRDHIAPTKRALHP
jgi:transcriptional antiterminator RfaH